MDKAMDQQIKEEIKEIENSGNNMECVRLSNLALGKSYIATFITFYFSIIGIGSSIVASEINNYNNENDKNKDQIIT